MSRYSHLDNRQLRHLLADPKVGKLAKAKIRRELEGRGNTVGLAATLKDGVLRLTVPWELCASKNMLSGGRNASIQYSSIITQAKQHVAELLEHPPQPIFDGEADAEIQMVLPNRKWDHLNFIDGLADCLQGAVIKNDRWLGDVLVRRPIVDRDHPRAEITVRTRS